MDEPGAAASARPVPRVLGVSLKSYLGVEQSRRWAAEIARIARTHAAVRCGAVEVFVLPSLPAFPGVRDALVRTKVRVGAQDLHTDDRGAHTGAVSGADLHEIGCRLVEIGHAERRTVFGEGPDVARAKMRAAVRNQLTPVLCIGEPERSDPAAAASRCLEQVRSILAGVGEMTELLVAYEPEWAIGRPTPAPPAYVREVAAFLRAGITRTGGGTRLIYGGSAQRGTLTELSGAVDGLFLGRFAHDQASFAGILDEAAALS
ncbi:MAG: triose-phosphate isomerase [Microbacterium sp.]|uniref:triose-phosphate isomerase family protein n=1 Tax=Microbacterium sp. TaxID=51671 RepID=UPI000C44E266|nr:triose-phosphate isomerase family protein [Microbacterium sp.]MAY50039.1 triose-phosphate isomerase [Microbacterium sp.]